MGVNDTQRGFSDMVGGIPPTVSALAITVLLALGLLVLLRHLFGSARLEVGTK